LLHRIDVIRQTPGKIEILLDQENGHAAFLLEALDRLLNVQNDRRLNAFSGFIEEEQRRLSHQSTSNGELLLLTTAEQSAFSGEHRLEPGEALKNLIRNRAVADATCHKSDAQVRVHREIREDFPPLRDIANATPCTLVRGQHRELLAMERDRPRPQAQQTHDTL